MTKTRIWLGIGLISLLLLTGCCTTNTHISEVNEYCTPYCASKGMAYSQSSSQYCPSPHKIICSCQGEFLR